MNRNQLHGAMVYSWSKNCSNWKLYKAPSNFCSSLVLCLRCCYLRFYLHDFPIHSKAHILYYSTRISPMTVSQRMMNNSDWDKSWVFDGSHHISPIIGVWLQRIHCLKNNKNETMIFPNLHLVVFHDHLHNKFYCISNAINFKWHH